MPVLTPYMISRASILLLEHGAAAADGRQRLLAELHGLAVAGHGDDVFDAQGLAVQDLGHGVGALDGCGRGGRGGGPARRARDAFGGKVTAAAAARNRPTAARRRGGRGRGRRPRRRYFSATSSSIMTAKPSIAPMVATCVFCPSCDSGMTSSTTT